MKKKARQKVDFCWVFRPGTGWPSIEINGWLSIGWFSPNGFNNMNLKRSTWVSGWFDSCLGLGPATSIYRWLFQLDDEPIFYVGNGWKSPFPFIKQVGWLSGSRISGWLCVYIDSLMIRMLFGHPKRELKLGALQLSILELQHFQKVIIFSSSINKYLEPQTTIYKWIFGETIIFYIKIWNHPIEMVVFGVPGRIVFCFAFVFCGSSLKDLAPETAIFSCEMSLLSGLYHV